MTSASKAIRNWLGIGGKQRLRILGAFDNYDGTHITGWATTSASDQIQVEIILDNQVVDMVSCNRFRQDLKNASIGDGHHGFSFAVPDRFQDGNKHEVVVAASHKKNRKELGRRTFFFYFNDKTNSGSPADLGRMLQPTGKIEECKNGRIRGWITGFNRDVRPYLTANGRPCRIDTFGLPQPQIQQEQSIGPPPGFTAVFPETAFGEQQISLHAITVDGIIPIDRMTVQSGRQVSTGVSAIANAYGVSKQDASICIIADKTAPESLSQIQAICDQVRTASRPVCVFYFDKDGNCNPNASCDIANCDSLVEIPWRDREFYLRQLRQMHFEFNTLWLTEPSYPAICLAGALYHPNAAMLIEKTGADADAVATTTDQPSLTLTSRMETTFRNVVSYAQDAGKDLPAREQLSNQHAAALTELFNWSETEPPVQPKMSPKNVLIVWKQHDAGMYGRRVDQLARAAKQAGYCVTCLELMTDSHLAHYAATADQVESDANLIFHDYQQKQHGYERDGITYMSFSFTNERSPKSVLKRYLLSERIVPTNTVAILFPATTLWDEILETLNGYQMICDIVDNQLFWEKDKPIDLLSQYKTFIDASKCTVFNSAQNSDFFLQAKLTSVAQTQTIPNWYMLPAGAHIPNRCTRDGRQLLNIVYSGNMNDRIDWALLKKLDTLSLPVRYHLVGTCQGVQAEMIDILGSEKFVYHGPKREIDLLRLLCKSDMAILPHLADDCSSYMNPIKVSMFACLGLPCISTQIAGVDFSRTGIFEASTHEEFIRILTETGAEILKKNTSRMTLKQVGDFSKYIALISELMP